MNTLETKQIIGHSTRSMESGQVMCIEMQEFLNLELDPSLSENFNVYCIMNIFDGEKHEQVSMAAVYNIKHNEIQSCVESHQAANANILVSVKDKNALLEFYKKNRIKCNVIFKPIESNNATIQSVALYSDLDIYMMAMNDLKYQENYYHLMDDSNIVGQVRIRFWLKSENMNEPKPTWLNPTVEDSDTSNEATQGIVTFWSLELKSAIQRSMDSRQEIEKALKKETRSMDNLGFKNILKTKAEKFSYEPEKALKSRHKNDYEFKRRFMKMHIEGSNISQLQPEVCNSFLKMYNIVGYLSCRIVSRWRQGE